jgi:hypothetical protein
MINPVVVHIIDSVSTQSNQHIRSSTPSCSYGEVLLDVREGAANVAADVREGGAAR